MANIELADVVDDSTIELSSDLLQVKDSGITTDKLGDDAVTYAKVQNVSATDRLLGRDTAAAGNIEELTVSGGIEFTGSGGIQTSALTGDVTKAAGGTATTIANDAVTYAKMQDVSAASKLLGRGDSGSGDPQEITLGAGLTMAGTTISAGGGGLGDVTGPASSTDNAFARFDGAGGKTIQNSTDATLDDAGRATVKALRIPLFDAGNSGSSKTIDWNDGNEQRVTLTDNVTFTLSNPGDGGRYVLILNQDGTGGRTVTWPAAVKWPSGSSPTITSGADKFDLVTLIYLATETIYLASINQSYDD